ncbi:MAG: HEAT repeat domain-containing protein [Isosphaeraceae bacterium]|nr:HEAT repeat domain-containing protein [Isosphaeraceae bacterium]
MRSALAFSILAAASATAAAQGFPPAEAAARMRVADGLESRLVASEPLIRQPVAVDFDDRGRLWVIQYLQYPNPKGLERVEVDRFSRTKYDRIPDPPPKGPRGSDRITILLDDDGDGVADRTRDFVDGLNLASGFAFGRGGVYVLQAPYLLFYADRDRDDRPDGDPEVLLSGFGMEDAHSVANSLTWGPDGRLYGLQGSTVTARINGIEFQQGVWRFDPETREFELFAEGGGNMWGLDFDRDGECFASTNVGGNILLHFVRGAYYWKQFAKHGNLHNSYAYGFFDHVPHESIRGGHVSVGGLFYEADAFPSEWRGAYLAADLLEHAVRRHSITSDRSSYRGGQRGDLLEARDSWFAPSDLTLGPDGCLYVADWHDARTAHPDPDADWDRRNGRIYRIQPTGFRPREIADLDASSTEQLVEMLSHSNQWFVRRARRLLIERRDPRLIPRLSGIVDDCGGRIPCVEALWVLAGIGGLDAGRAAAWIDHPDPATRSALIRLTADRPEIASKISSRFEARARSESVPRVRSHLAHLAGVISDAERSIGLIRALAARSEDADDPMIPLRLWWSLEKTISRALIDDPGDSAARLAPFRAFISPGRGSERSKIVDEFLAPRVARRILAEATPARMSWFLERIAEEADPLHRERLATAADQATRGRTLEASPEAVARLVALEPAPWESTSLTSLLARAGSTTAREVVVRDLLDSRVSETRRAAFARVLAEIDPTRAVRELTRFALDDSHPVLRDAAFSELGRFDSTETTRSLLSTYDSRPESVRRSIRASLSSRASSASKLLLEVEAGRIASSDFGLDEVRRLVLLREGADAIEVGKLVSKHWGRLQPATPEEKLAEVRRLNNDLRAGSGDRASGKRLFRENCSGCHILFGEGTGVGPELTHANRKDRDFLLTSLVAPSDVIRREYRSIDVALDDGRVLSGLPVAGSNDPLILIQGVDRRISIEKSRIEEIKESSSSLMPEDLHRRFSPSQLRDLFAYLQSETPTPAERGSR